MTVIEIDFAIQNVVDVQVEKEPNLISLRCHTSDKSGIILIQVVLTAKNLFAQNSHRLIPGGHQADTYARMYLFLWPTKLPV